MAVYYEVPEVIIGKKQKINLVDYLPEDWKIKRAQSASINNMPPEVIQSFLGLHAVIWEKQEIVLGSIYDESFGTAEVWCERVLKDVLTARALHETGQPYNEIAAEAVASAVIKRRDEVVKAIAANSKNVRDVMLRSFVTNET